MEGRQRRSFTDDYKRQAVDLVASSGRSIGSVAKELGVNKRPRVTPPPLGRSIA
jgi:transposase-like protein